MDTEQAGTEPVEFIKQRRNHNHERYARVDKMWPEKVPELSAQEALSAFKHLWRIATGKPFSALSTKRKVRFVSGNRYHHLYYEELVLNPSRGWHSLVHFISHRTHKYVASREHRGHGTSHASHEAWLVHEVVSRGWLEGKLRRPEKAKPERNIKAERKDRLEARLKAWEGRQRRAERAAKKIAKQLKRYQ